MSMTARQPASDRPLSDADDHTAVAALLARRFRRAYIAHALAGLLPRRRRWPLKRTLDLVVALPLLVIGAPVSLAIAASVWVRFHRRAVVMQACAGRGGETLLLRQLYAAPTAAERGAGGEDADAQDAWRSESRLARWPALWSVLTGKMSLVGPAPWTLDALAARPTDEMARLYVAPGALRLRPVGRLRRLASDQTEADLRYISDGSLWMDIQQIIGAALMRGRRFS